MHILSILLIASALIGLSLGYCPTGCTCIQKTVRCIQLHLTAIPKVPEDTYILDLRFNQLKEVPSRAFEGLTQVHTIFLSENQISAIQDDAFKGMVSLKYLYLASNHISKISPNAFKGLKQLEILYLEKNDIWELDEKTFQHHLPNLEILLLFNNKITSLPNGAFDNLPKLRRLLLDGNPIECDCGIHSLLQLSRKSPKAISLICDSPQILHRKSFAHLRDQDFHCRKPEIIQEPQDAAVNTGETIELPCQIIGDPAPDVHWIQNANEIPTDGLPRIEILDDGALRIRNVQPDDVGVYVCLGRNSVGEVKSRPVRMVLNSDNQLNGQPQRPRFTHTPPAELTVTTNDAIVLDCSAIGSPEPQIQWYFNERQMSHSTQLTRVHMNGTLLVSRATLRNAGTYKCEASNHLGDVYASVKVQINELPEIILAPESQTVKSGTTLILECDADGDPQPTIAWKRNGTLIVASPGEATAAPNRISLHNENTELQIEHIKLSDAGEYTCVAKNDKGMIEVTADIIVENAWGPPRLIYEPFNMEAVTGITIELPCKGEGEPAPEVTWRKDGRLIAKDITEKYKISSTGSLYVKNVTVIDGGRYECSITNEYGRVTASGLVTIKTIEILAPGDRYVHIAFAEATKEIDLAINSTIDVLFGSKAPANLNHGELLRVFRFPTGEARQLARAAEIYERTLVNIRKHVKKGDNISIGSTDFEYKELLSAEHLHLVAELSGCMSHRRMPNCTDMCFHSKYRTNDGTCNNLNNPTWGASLTAFRRIHKPIYENGFSMPIGWTKGKLYNGFEKPLARLVSTSLISTKEITADARITHMVMQWGQFLDHDLDHAIPSVSSESWDGVDCKKTCEYAPPCFPMDVPPNDPRVKNRRCIDLVRSSAICGSGMTSVFFDSVQSREQINQLTAYIDASQVYGYTTEFAQELRNLTTNDGLLRSGVHFPKQKEMLPFAAPQDGIDCRRNLNENDMNCFVAGDIRANEQVGLLAMHTIWLREHNRIAIKLKELNPHWDGDTLYEESRKIVGAQMQHVTFKQWLPIIVGPEGMKMMGEYQGYNPSVNPSISNEFATAALRFGHTLINPILHRLNETFQPIPQGHLPLHKAFFAPWRLAYEGGVDPLMRGFFSVPAKLKTPDQNMNSELTEKLFHTAHAVALDLASMNIQRGRDHGIPGYNEYRRFCNLTVAKTFDDLKGEISSAEIRNKMKELYGHPDNIDIFVGGILEDQVEGAKIGPLFRCLLVDQFKRLRDADRFYYENPSVFLPEQLQEIRQTNLARVLCDNGDNITRINEDVFLLPSKQGGYKSCLDIPGINLYFWQDCGSCSSLSPLLKTYVPATYPKRSKRSVDFDASPSMDGDDFESELQDMKEERISGLEEVISNFQKELKKLRKKVHHLEETCHAESETDASNAKPNSKRHHCHDADGAKRLNNEIWDQDECTKCECKHSEVTCIREKCGVMACPNELEPITSTGDCCPHCPVVERNIKRTIGV